MQLALRAIAALVLVARLYAPVFAQEASATPLTLTPIAEFKTNDDRLFPSLDSERGAIILSGVFGRNLFNRTQEIRVLDLKTGATLAVRSYKEIKCQKGGQFYLETLMLLPGKPELLVKACNGLTVLDRNDLSVKRQLVIGQHNKDGSTYGVGDMMLSPDGTRLVVKMHPARERYTTDIYDTTTWNVVASWPMRAVAFAFAADGRRLAIFHSADFEFNKCGIAVLGFPSGELVGDFTIPDCEQAAYEGMADFRTVPWNPDLLAIQRLNGRPFLWNMSIGEIADSTVLQPPGRGAPLGGIAFSPNGKWIAAQLSETDPKRIREFTIWVVKTGKIIADSIAMPRGGPAPFLPRSTSLEITRDSRFVMAQTTFVPLVRIYEVPATASTADVP